MDRRITALLWRATTCDKPKENYYLTLQLPSVLQSFMTSITFRFFLSFPASELHCFDSLAAVFQ